MTPTRVLIVGAGTMGRGIAETAAVHRLGVDVVEIAPAVRDAAQSQIRASVERGLQRGKIQAASVDEVLARIAWHADLAVARTAEFVIEAVVEREPVKRSVLQELDALCPPGAILASNTSSVSISRLAAATGRPAQVVGMHFFNPVPIMRPVEIVRGAETSDATIAATRELAIRLGKQAFVVADTPGFAVNRILMPLLNEAAYALQDQVADAATIDSLMKLGCGHPMGPLELADLVGLDVCLSILQVLHQDLGDDKFRPCPLLVELVAAGRLGRKTGRGFYEYA